ncbi:MAG TPA: carbon storage regulator CsrA [Anaerolineae bacterium]|nr:carbon storage regulator CsrA [Anaerolineae bacterium]
MLVLGRKVGERIMIGDDIILTVLAIDENKIKLGLEAPGDVRILRGELYESVKAENLRAATLSSQSQAALLPSLSRLLKKETQSEPQPEI